MLEKIKNLILICDDKILLNTKILILEIDGWKLLLAKKTKEAKN
jgi:hypothetical protein